MNYNVLFTDYVSYTVIYNCVQVTKNEIEEAFWILGRENTMPLQQIKELELKVQSVLPNYNFENTVQTPQKNCKYESAEKFLL